MRRVFPAILLACFAVPFFAFIAAPLRAETGPGRPEEFAAGQALAEHLRSAVPEENSEFHGRLIIKSEGASRRSRSSAGLPSTRPTGRRIMKRPGPPNPARSASWCCTAPTGPTNISMRGPRRLPPHCPNPRPCRRRMFPLPWPGSDFSLADLGLEFLHWPVQRQLKGEMRLGEPCYVLESSDPQARDIVRVKSDIDKEFGAPLIADAYDAQGHVVKEYSLHGSSFKKVNGRWQVEKMEIRNKKTGSHTELKFDLNK